MTLKPFLVDFLSDRARKIYDSKNVGHQFTVMLSKGGKPLLTLTPVPRFDLLKLSEYSSVSLQFSRGCPFNCDFCDITLLYGRESRTKTSTQMISELEAIFSTGWRGSIFIVDDNFIGNVKHVREFLPVLIRWQQEHRYPFTFFTEGSVNLANENMRDVLNMMVTAGFTDVFVGIESTNLDVLKAMNKGQNTKGDLGDKVRAIQGAGLEVTAGFIIGSDADKPSVFDELFGFIQDNGIVISMAGLLTALHGTELYKRLKFEGRLRAESSGNNTHGFGFNFDPVLDERFLIDGYVKLLEKLFSPKNYFARCITLRRRQVKYIRSRNVNGSWQHATIVVLYRNLIRRPNWYFAKFIFCTFLTSPLDMPKAITQAVKFEHFRNITQAASLTYQMQCRT
jgi:radical SAM superfamily enzyme YgiQ (UPF0313 family)